MPKRFNDWIKQAEDDLAHAKESLKIGHYNWACFASQQSAEKALKALYEFLGGEGWGHSVVKLLKELPPDKAQITESLLEEAVYLDKLYIPTRYPNGFTSGASVDYYVENNAREAIEYAADILSFIKTKIR